MFVRRNTLRLRADVRRPRSTTPCKVVASCALDAQVQRKQNGTCCEWECSHWMRHIKGFAFEFAHAHTVDWASNSTLAPWFQKIAWHKPSNQTPLCDEIEMLPFAFVTAKLNKSNFSRGNFQEESSTHSETTALLLVSAAEFHATFLSDNTRVRAAHHESTSGQSLRHDVVTQPPASQCKQLRWWKQRAWCNARPCVTPVHTGRERRNVLSAWQHKLWKPLLPRRVFTHSAAGAALGK